MFRNNNKLVRRTTLKFVYILLIIFAQKILKLEPADNDTIRFTYRFPKRDYFLSTINDYKSIWEQLILKLIKVLLQTQKSSNFGKFFS